jgi:hypothetical protein
VDSQPVSEPENAHFLHFDVLSSSPLSISHRTAYTGMIDYMIVSEKKENNNTVRPVFKLFMSIQ